MPLRACGCDQPVQPPSPRRRDSPRFVARATWRLTGLSAAHDITRCWSQASCLDGAARGSCRAHSAAPVQPALCATCRQRIHALGKAPRSRRGSSWLSLRAIRIEAPESQTTVIQRDVYGKPLNISRTALVDGSSTTVGRAYQYDTQQRLCTRYEPETGFSVFNYDAADNLWWSAHGRSAAGDCNNSRNAVAVADRIIRQYDPRNRVTLIDYPGATADTSYTYKRDGQVETASRNNSIWTYGYTSLGALASETLSFAGQTRQFLHGYDSLGNRKSITYPGGELVGFSPDALGQITQVGTYANTISFYANGSVKQASLGNGLLFNRTLNTRLLPQRLSYKLGTQPQVDLLLSFDENGNVTNIGDMRPGGTDSQNFQNGYDGLDRLISGSGPYGAVSYEYDAFDNIRRHVLGTRDLRYKYADGSNRLTSITLPDSTPVLSYLYNSRGAVTSAGPAQLTFDLAETVTQYNGPTGLESYLYDANDHRIQVSNSSGISYPVYTQDGLLRAEYGTQTQTYYYLGTQLIARSGIGQRLDLIFSSGFEALVGSSMMNAIKSFLDKAAQSVVTTYYLDDHLGSNIATADQTGAIIERSRFAPFGERWSEATERGPGYAGHFEDATGMTYMKARYYGGIVGRFISPDPVSVDTSTGGNFNRYWYANNNPQRFVDPDGRIAQVAYPIFEAAVVAVETCAASIYCGAAVVIAVAVASDPKGSFNNAVANAWSEGVRGNLAWKGVPVYQASETDDAESKLSEGKGLAPGKDGKKGVLHGDGGSDQADKDFDSVDGKEVKTKNGARVKILKDGGVIEMHDSTGSNPEVPKGTRTIKIQKVKPDGGREVVRTIRYPKK